MDSTYHEAFWVAVAAATPVIVIGYLVVFERLIKYEPKLPPKRRYYNKTRTIQTKDGPETIRRRVRRKSVASLFTNLVMIIGMCLPTVGLGAALSSLANEKDDSTFSWWANFLMYDLFLLLLASFVSVAWQMLRALDDKEPQATVKDDGEE